MNGDSEIRGCIMPPHGGKSFVTAALKRQMKLWTKIIESRRAFGKAFGYHNRFYRTQTQSQIGGAAMHRFHNVYKPCAVRQVLSV